MHVTVRASPCLHIDSRWSIQRNVRRRELNMWRIETGWPVCIGVIEPVGAEAVVGGERSDAILSSVDESAAGRDDLAVPVGSCKPDVLEARVDGARGFGRPLQCLAQP